MTLPLERLTFADVAALSRGAADMIVEAGRAAVAARGRFTLCLSGGSTPRTLYEVLAAEYRERVPWLATWMYFGDERCVPPDHPDSNFGMARDALLAHVPGLESRTQRIEGERPASDAAARYDAVLRTAFGAPGGPTFDMLLLGVGTDGHTASLFPGSPALAERSQWAVRRQHRRPQSRRVASRSHFQPWTERPRHSFSAPAPTSETSSGRSKLPAPARGLGFP